LWASCPNFVDFSSKRNSQGRRWNNFGPIHNTINPQPQPLIRIIIQQSTNGTITKQYFWPLVGDGMFPYNLLPETPDISAINNKKASLIPNPRYSYPRHPQSSPEVHLEIFSYLDHGASACFGFTCNKFYSIHRNIHGTVNLYAYNPLPSPHGLDLRRLYDHLNGWMGPNLWFNHTTGKFVTRERFRYRAEKCYGRRGR
jgi:hypothetical protein